MVRSLHAAAKLLPSKFVTCDKLTPSTERSTRSPATDCLAKNETACALPECVWCESAIGGACFTPKVSVRAVRVLGWGGWRAPRHGT